MRSILILLVYFSLLVLPVSAQDKPFKVGFVTVGSVSDLGWNYGHNQGRLYLQKSMPGQVETSIIENVPENAGLERVLEKMIAQGNKLIFTTSYGHLEPAARVAKRHPDIVIMQCQRTVPAGLKNMGTYFPNQYDLMYVTGFVAGKLSKSGKLGYVTAHPVPLLLNCINAFALGAQRANPQAKVQVVWINNWSDPALEAEATKGLAESGVDVVASQLDTALTVTKTAEKLGIKSIGCDAELDKIAPKSWLTGCHFNWGPLYVKMTKLVLEHKWKSDDYFFETKEGYNVLSPFGQSVPPKVQAEALTLQKQIETGKLVVFQGPLADRNGKQRIPTGKKASKQQMDNMDWFVPGVLGSLPKK